MRITVTAMGSRGDVQPFAALAVALAARGHEATLVTHTEFEGLAAGRGVRFAPITGDIRQDLTSGIGRDLMEKGRNPLRIMRYMIESSKVYARRWGAEIIEAAQGSELVVATGASFYVGAPVAEKLGVPFVQAYPQPLVPSRRYPSPLVPPPPFPVPGAANLAMHHAVAQMFWQALRPATNMGRTEMLGLEPWPLRGPFARLRAERRPVLLAFSPEVVPPAPDWPDFVEATGYWFLDDPGDGPGGWTPPGDLARFLEAGPPPVYIGFGSMGVRDPEETGALVVEAVRRAGVRAVLASGWAGIGAADLPPEVHLIEGAPHDLLFPRMAAA
ncbi:MAG TPA: glycosyltransferase, partial [Azospirillaceae bacterium]|nr:glycosyltransferase [Azospirillaceae bacterium]